MLNLFCRFYLYSDIFLILVPSLRFPFCLNYYFVLFKVLCLCIEGGLGEHKNFCKPLEDYGPRLVDIQGVPKNMTEKRKKFTNNFYSNFFCQNRIKLLLENFRLRFFQAAAK